MRRWTAKHIAAFIIRSSIEQTPIDRSLAHLLSSTELVIPSVIFNHQVFFADLIHN